MISNSSVSLPGLDNCYQKTLPSNKSKTPLLHKSFGTIQTHFELLGRYSYVEHDAKQPVVLTVHWEDAGRAATPVRFTTYQISTFTTEAYLQTEKNTGRAAKPVYETDITKDAILLPSTFPGAGSGPKLTSDSSIAVIGYDKKNLYQILHVKQFCRSLPSRTPEDTVCNR